MTPEAIEAAQAAFSSGVSLGVVLGAGLLLAVQALWSMWTDRKS